MHHHENVLFVINPRFRSLRGGSVILATCQFGALNGNRRMQIRGPKAEGPKESMEELKESDHRYAIQSTAFGW